jgi:hypothetical protein
MVAGLVFLADTPSTPYSGNFLSLDHIEFSADPVNLRWFLLNLYQQPLRDHLAIIDIFNVSRDTSMMKFVKPYRLSLTRSSTQSKLLPPFT